MLLQADDGSLDLFAEQLCKPFEKRQATASLADTSNDDEMDNSLLVQMDRGRILPMHSALANENMQRGSAQLVDENEKSAAEVAAGS